MVQQTISTLKNHETFLLKAVLCFAIAVVIGVFLPTVLPLGAVSVLRDTAAQLQEALKQPEQLVPLDFFSVLIGYGCGLLLLWLSGGSRLGTLPAFFLLLCYGCLLGVALRIVFSLGFAYGVLIFLLSMLPGNFLILLAVLFAFLPILRQEEDFLRYTCGFLPSLLCVFFAGIYWAFIGPVLFQGIMRLI